MARPTKLTPELQDQILALIRRGLTKADAGRAVGLHRTTVNDWCLRGDRDADTPYNPNGKTRNEILADLTAADITYPKTTTLPQARKLAAEHLTGRTPFSDFSDAVAAAASRGQAILVSLIYDDAHTNPESAKWLLERRWPEQWGRARRDDRTFTAPTDSPTVDPAAALTRGEAVVLKLVEHRQAQ